MGSVYQQCVFLSWTVCVCELLAADDHDANRDLTCRTWNHAILLDRNTACNQKARFGTRTFLETLAFCRSAVGANA